MGRRVFGMVGRSWLLAGLVVLACAPAFAQGKPLKGVALVVAQSDYGSLPDLANTANDAREVQKLLADLGFEVQTVSDGDRRRLDRQLERFVEDAEEADVALLYYSGHGIEVGGENYLVPVDADTSALDAAEAKLVPLASHLEALRRAVAISIVLLDACRTNPFPPGATLKTAAAQAGLAVTPAGLGQPRSVTPFAARAGAADESFGSVIGYSASPGQVALDGEPGGNSPYADALVRHLSAMAGEEFGLVLRMVAEEVYLKTRGAQRPWINESLRRLLYLGAAPQEPEGAEGDILHERRRLLVTISTLPDRSRREVEAISATGSVPMDAVFAMLASLGEDAPSDPVELDRLLRAQAEKLKEMRAERDAVTTSDPEIARLTALANTAVDEGALAAAVGLHEQIKARIGALSARIDAVEENLRARRLEFAAAYARSAETLNLAFDYPAAARDYHAAFLEAQRWDRALAWKYRLNEGLALWNHGDQRGDNQAIRDAIAAYRDALDYQTGDAADHALTRNNIGVALVELGTRLGDPAMLAEAAQTHRQALEVFTRESDAGQWAWTQSLLANALLMRSGYEDGSEDFAAAIAAYTASLEVRTRASAPVDWARVQQNIGVAHFRQAQRSSAPADVDRAIAAFERAAEVFTRDAIPFEWANTQANLAAAKRFKANLTDDTELLKQAGAIYREVLSTLDRDKLPLEWSRTYQNLANVLTDYGRWTKDASFVRSGVTILDEVLTVYTLEQNPVDWALAQSNRAFALRDLAELEKNDALLLEAAAGYRTALTGWTRERAPKDWAATIETLARLLTELAGKTGDAAHRAEARRLRASLLDGLDPQRAPARWAEARSGLALHDYEAGWTAGDVETLRLAAAGFREVRQLAAAARTADQNADTDYNLGLSYVEIAKLTGADADRRAAAAAFQAAAKAYGAEDKRGDRAKALNFAGAQLLELALAASDAALAGEAAAAFRAALAASEESAADYDPATVWNELGRALQTVGDATGDRAKLAEAAAAFERAAALFAAAGTPLDRAIAVSNRGLVELSLGHEGEGAAAHAARAAELLRDALAGFQTAGETLSATQARFNLGRALQAQASLTADGALLDQAIDTYRQALGEWPADGSRAQDWAFNQSLLGETLRERAEAAPGRQADLSAAIEALAAAETVYPRGTAPADFAGLRNSIAYARVLLAEATRDGAQFQTAVADARVALSAQVESGEPANLPYIRDTLCRGLVGLGEARGDRAALAEAVSLCETAIAEFRAADAGEPAAETARNLDRARAALAALDQQR